MVKILADSHQALLYDKQNRTHVLVEEGTTVGDLEVQTIDGDEVTLAAEGLEVVLAAPDQGRRGKGRGKAPARPARVAEAAETVEKAPTSVGPWTRESVQAQPEKPAVKASAPAPAATVPTIDEADLPEKDPYFVVEPPTITPYDEVEGEPEHPADPYAVPEGTATVTAQAKAETGSGSGSGSEEEEEEEDSAVAAAPHANPYETAPVARAPRPAAAPHEETVSPYEEVVEIQDDDMAEPAVVAATPATTVIARRDLDAALADFGTLTRSLRGSFVASGAKLEQVANGSVFAKAGLRPGDVVTSVDGRPVRSIDDAAELYVRAQTTRATNVQILRAGKAITLKVQIR
ncbi:MAG: PDZ domain-containing protein [Kofleriaceae bacterium]|nr:PDZ domain-containing protein [Kofleriaceae bacterium]